MQSISRFFLAGINYKKTDAAVRGQFAFSRERYARLLQEARPSGISEVFVLSTCNRTEIYGLAADADQLADLLCRHAEGSRTVFEERAYKLCGMDAIQHLFEVAAGLDSQILGDYEIVGQIKQAVRVAREEGAVGAFTDRLVNCVLQSSKVIKNKTNLSGGTVSVSFSAVQYIRQAMPDFAGKRILLVGAGKIGRNTCRNLVDYLPGAILTLTNRTEARGRELAADLNLRFTPYEHLEEELRLADIVIVATDAPEPTVLSTHLQHAGPKLLIDLSIPNNIEPAAGKLPGNTLVNVDELSRLKDETLHMRRGEVPKARKIIAQHVREFKEWIEMRRYVPVLRAVKSKLLEIHGKHAPLQVAVDPAGEGQAHRERIQKIINGMAVRMREENRQGCHYIEAINEYMGTGLN